MSVRTCLWALTENNGLSPYYTAPWYITKQRVEVLPTFLLDLPDIRIIL